VILEWLLHHEHSPVGHQPIYDLCRDTSIVVKIDAPLPAADVRKPARTEWPENSAASNPDRAVFFDDVCNESIGKLRGPHGVRFIEIGPASIPARPAMLGEFWRGKRRRREQSRSSCPRVPDRSSCRRFGLEHFPLDMGHYAYPDCRKSLAHRSGANVLADQLHQRCHGTSGTLAQRGLHL
jgi:hypothetical protein